MSEQLPEHEIQLKRAATFAAQGITSQEVAIAGVVLSRELDRPPTVDETLDYIESFIGWRKRVLSAKSLVDDAFQSKGDGHI